MRCGIESDSHRIANPGRKDALAVAIGIEFKNICAVFFRGMRIGIIMIRVRTDGYEHFLSVWRKCDVAGPMPAASNPRAGGKIWHDRLWLFSRFKIALLILEANHRPSIADVNPLWVRTRGIKLDTPRTFQPSRIDFHLFGFAFCIHSAKDFDLACAALGEEDVPIG